MSYGLGLCHTILFILNLFKIKKITKIKLHLISNILGFSLLLLPTILLNKSIWGILQRITHPLFGILITSIISFLVYIMLIFVFNILDRNGIKIYLKQFIKKNTTTK